MKALRLDAAIWPPRLGELDFEKNQLFDLRTDLAHSWGRPGDWRSQKLILTTFVFEILYGRWSALMRWSWNNFFLNGQILVFNSSFERAWWDTQDEPINVFLISGGPYPASNPITFMWIAYEHFTLGNKGSTIQQKLASINRWHAERGHLEPFHYAMEAKHFLEEIVSTDKPPQGRLPVPMQLKNYYVLTTDLEDFDVLVNATAMATGGCFCLRSKEYLGPDTGKIDPRATHWRDATSKIDHTPVSGNTPR